LNIEKIVFLEIDSSLGTGFRYIFFQRKTKSLFGSAAAFYLKCSCSYLVKEKEGILFIGPTFFCVGNTVFEKQEFLVFFAMFTLIALFNEQCN